MSRKIIRVEMNSRLHDEARVVSARFDFSCGELDGPKKLLDLLEAGMNAINAWADEKGVIIGHLKGYLAWDGGTVMLSTTGEEVQVKGQNVLPDSSCMLNIGLAAIVFGTKPGEMEKQLEGMLEGLFGAFGAGFSIAYDDHDHDHHMHKHEHHHEHGESCDCGDEHHHRHEHGRETEPDLHN